MMKKNKTIIALYDNKIQYITLAKNSYGFYIQDYDSAALEPGIIKNGEILKADFLKKIISKISQKIKTKSIDLILPHDYFLFDLHTVQNKKQKNKKILFKKYIKENKGKISWRASHVYEYELFDEENELKILFRTLPQEIYSSYKYVFEKAGLSINSLQSDIVAFSDLLAKDKRLTQIFVSDMSTHVLEYKDGIYISDKKFNFSYTQLITDIKKNIHTSDDEAQDILEKYGVLRTHKDTKVLRKIERSMTPLFDFLRQRKIKGKSTLYVHFSKTPIKGFSDRIRKILKLDVVDLCVLCSSQYTFQDVLTLHKKDSYEYEALIARGVSLFEN